MSRPSMGIAPAVLAVLGLLAGCKKDVAYSGPEGQGAAPATATAETPASEPPPESAAPQAENPPPAVEGDPSLPPLDPSPVAPAATATTTAKAKTTTTTKTPAKGEPPAECAEAQRLCSHPAVGTLDAVRARCEAAKSICTQKGGTVPP